MTCEVHGNKECNCCKEGKSNAFCTINRILKALTNVFKITTLVGLTFVLFDIHAGLKAEFQNAQAQAMMMSAGPAAMPAAPSK